MIDKKADSIIRELSAELKALYPDFRGIYLFGSHARGEAREDSDIDIAILFDRAIQRNFADDIMNLIYDYELKYDVFLDSFPFKYKDIMEPITYLRFNVHMEGILYG
ncbi:MAG: transf 2 protein [Bacteroidota bacterium]|nr:transf 2 protein [Bacteroidota bacterium]